MTPLLASFYPVWAFIHQFKYVLVFIGVILEGPFLMIASGFLLHKGAFSLLPLFTALVLGDLLADVGWYYIGYFFLDTVVKKYGHILGVTPEIELRSKELFNKYHARILFISKVTLGFGMALATLMVAGASRIPLRKFLFLNFWGECILVAILMTIGYFFGQLYSSIVEGFRVVFLVGAAALSVTFVLWFSKYMKAKIALV